MTFNKSETRILNAFCPSKRYDQLVWPAKNMPEATPAERRLHGYGVFTAVDVRYRSSRTTENLRLRNAVLKLAERGLVNVLKDEYVSVHHPVHNGNYMSGCNYGVRFELTAEGRELVKGMEN